ncbi:MAG: Ig-like domain-containing protein [Rubrivivax sp.]|nr:Ig-like domain-containing protein [Rubrivivax sp.]
MDTRNWMLRCRHGAAVVLLAGLAACGGGGGGGGGSEPPAGLAGNFFPLAVGDRWVYDIGSGAALTVRASGTRTVDGQTGIVVLTEDPTDGSAESVYIVTAAAVRQVPTLGGDPLVSAIGPLDVMRFPLVAGDRWTQIDKTLDTGMDFDGDGRLERATVHSEVQVIGLETVTTPVATFTGSLHQRTTLTVGVMLTSMPQTITVVTTVDDWYAPDIGPVRTTLLITSQGVSETQTVALTAYRVGTLRSDEVAPTVLAVTPADGGTMRADGHLVVNFSEAMDFGSVAAAVTLTTTGGQPVPLSVSAQGNSYSFHSSGGLATGRYTARVATGAADLFGNPLAQATTWTFDIVATGP